MDRKVKSGKEILDEFFSGLTNIPDADKKLTEKIKSLYDNNELTETRIVQLLQSIREEEMHDKD